jgi:hypothetical protein
MPQAPRWDAHDAHMMRLQGHTWRAIADHFGVRGESTIREGVRRYLGIGERDLARSQAAATALAARWQARSTDRTFGVEIEFHTAIRGEVAAALEAVLGYHIHMTGYHGNICVTCRQPVSGYTQWKLETDSSATQGMSNAGAEPWNQGGELVSPVLKGAAGLREIEKVMAALRSVGAKVDRRHGMHVHLGVADIMGDNRARLFRNYKQAQNTLFRLVAKSRQNNTYCRKLAEFDIEQRAIAAECNYPMRGSHTDSMNISNIGRIGTIEMRMHQGTLSGKKATEWVKLLIAFFDASRDGIVIDADNELVDTLLANGKISAASAEWLKNRQETLYPTAVAA